MKSIMGSNTMFMMFYHDCKVCDETLEEEEAISRIEGRNKQLTTTRELWLNYLTQPKGKNFIKVEHKDSF